MPLCLKFLEENLQFLLQQFERVVGADAENLADRKHERFSVVDDPRVGADGLLTVGEGVQGVDGLVGRGAGLEVQHDFDGLGRVVVDLADFQFASFNGGGDGVLDQIDGVFAKRYLRDNQRLIIDNGNLGTVDDLAAQQSVVVLAHINGAAGREVGEQLEWLVFEDGDGSIQKFVEIVGQDVGGHAGGDALHTLRQQQWEADGQDDGFLVAAVVRHFPLGDFRGKDDFEGELGEAGFDITGGGCGVTGEDVTPVTLRVDGDVLLPELHDGVRDGSVAMRVVFHRVAHNVGHLVVAAVLQLRHGVQDAALHGFQSIQNVGQGAVEDGVGGVVQIPVLEHRLHIDHILQMRVTADFRGCGFCIIHIFRIFNLGVLILFVVHNVYH